MRAEKPFTGLSSLPAVFLAISEAYVLFTSQRYYIFSGFRVLTYYAFIVHTFIWYSLFVKYLDVISPYFLDKKQKLCKKNGKN